MPNEPPPSRLDSEDKLPSNNGRNKKLMSKTAAKHASEEPWFGVIIPVRSSQWDVTFEYSNYNTWWFFVVVATYFTAMFVPFEVAFAPDAGLCKLHFNGYDMIQLVLTAIFTIDIIVNFNLAYWNPTTGTWVRSRRKIARQYVIGTGMFWVDLISVVPFDLIVGLAATCSWSTEQMGRLLALLRLVRLIRLYRVWQLARSLERSATFSLAAFTVFRNAQMVLLITHIAACLFFFLADHVTYKSYEWAEFENIDYDDAYFTQSVNSWFDETRAGLAGMTTFERYLRSLYWSMTTFTTVGYGDFSPQTTTEQIFVTVYMLINLGLMAYITGTITLVVTKGDATTGQWRDSIRSMRKFINLHSLPTSLGDDDGLLPDMMAHMQLHFMHEQIRDADVLEKFPSALRRRILKALYKDVLRDTYIFNAPDVREAFLIALLEAATVELYMPGVNIVERGAKVEVLQLVVNGSIEVVWNIDEEYEPDDLEAEPTQKGNVSLRGLLLPHRPHLNNRMANGGGAAIRDVAGPPSIPKRHRDVAIAFKGVVDLALAQTRNIKAHYSQHKDQQEAKKAAKKAEQEMGAASAASGTPHARHSAFSAAAEKKAANAGNGAGDAGSSTRSGVAKDKLKGVWQGAQNGSNRERRSGAPTGGTGASSIEDEEDDLQAPSDTDSTDDNIRRNSEDKVAHTFEEPEDYGLNEAIATMEDAERPQHQQKKKKKKGVELQSPVAVMVEVDGEKKKLTGIETVHFRAGCPVGELAFYTHGEQLTTVRTATEARVLSITRDEYDRIAAIFPRSARAAFECFKRHAEAMPKFLEFLMRHVSHDLHTTSNQSAENPSEILRLPQNEGIQMSPGSLQDESLQTLLNSAVVSSGIPHGNVPKKYASCPSAAVPLAYLAQNCLPLPPYGELIDQGSSDPKHGTTGADIATGEAYLDHPKDQPNDRNLFMCATRVSTHDRVKALLHHALSSCDKVQGTMERHNEAARVNLVAAVHRGDVAEVEHLLQRRAANVNASDDWQRTALMFAAHAGNTDVLCKLLEKNANTHLVDASGSTALLMACRAQRRDAVRVLRDAGAPLVVAPSSRPDLEEGQIAGLLISAIKHGHRKRLEILLEAAGSSNWRSFDGNTPLHMAAAESDLQAVHTLLEYGADLFARDRLGDTAIDKARQVQAWNVLRLFQLYEDMNRQDQDSSQGGDSSNDASEPSTANASADTRGRRGTSTANGHSTPRHARVPSLSALNSGLNRSETTANGTASRQLSRTRSRSEGHISTLWQRSTPRSSTRELKRSAQSMGGARSSGAAYIADALQRTSGSIAGINQSLNADAASAQASYLTALSTEFSGPVTEGSVPGPHGPSAANAESPGTPVLFGRGDSRASTANRAQRPQSQNLWPAFNQAAASGAPQWAAESPSESGGGIGDAGPEQNSEGSQRPRSPGPGLASVPEGDRAGQSSEFSSNMPPLLTRFFDASAQMLQPLTGQHLPVSSASTTAPAQDADGRDRDDAVGSGSAEQEPARGSMRDGDEQSAPSERYSGEDASRRARHGHGPDSGGAEIMQLQQESVFSGPAAAPPRASSAGHSVDTSATLRLDSNDMSPQRAS